MIEVHRSVDGKPIYINIDAIESVGSDIHEPHLTIIYLRENDAVDCVEETPKAILMKVKSARLERLGRVNETVYVQ